MEFAQVLGYSNKKIQKYSTKVLYGMGLICPTSSFSGVKTQQLHKKIRIEN